MKPFPTTLKITQLIYFLLAEARAMMYFRTIIGDLLNEYYGVGNSGLEFRKRSV